MEEEQKNFFTASIFRNLKCCSTYVCLLV